MSTLTKVFTRIKRAPLTRKKIQEIFEISQSRALEIIQELRPQLVIVGYDQPPGKKPAPIYGHRVSSEQQDAPLVKAPRNRKPKRSRTAEKVLATKHAWKDLSESEKQRLRRERKLAYDRKYGAERREAKRASLSTPRVRKHRAEKRRAKMMETLRKTPNGILVESPMLALSMFFNKITKTEGETEIE